MRFWARWAAFICEPRSRIASGAGAASVSVRVALLLLVAVHEAAERPVLVAPLGERQLVKLGLLAQFQAVAQVRFADLVPVDRGTHRTARFAAMRAVGKPALASQQGDVGEAVSIPSAAPSRPSSRMPGMSIHSAPCASIIR